MKNKTYKFETDKEHGTLAAKSMEHAKSILVAGGKLPKQGQIDHGAYWWLEDVEKGLKIGAGKAASNA